VFHHTSRKTSQGDEEELQGLGQRLGSCNVSSRSRTKFWTSRSSLGLGDMGLGSRLGLGSEGLVHIPGLITIYYALSCIVVVRRLVFFNFKIKLAGCLSKLLSYYTDYSVPSYISHLHCKIRNNRKSGTILLICPLLTHLCPQFHKWNTQFDGESQNNLDTNGLTSFDELIAGYAFILWQNNTAANKYETVPNACWLLHN